MRPHRQAPPSLGFSRQEHWSGLPFPSPMHESEVTQSCLTPSDPMDCSLPGSSVYGILQAILLYWSGVPFPSPISTELLLIIPPLENYQYKELRVCMSKLQAFKMCTCVYRYAYIWDEDNYFSLQVWHIIFSSCNLSFFYLAVYLCHLYMSVHIALSSFFPSRFLVAAQFLFFSVLGLHCCVGFL